MSAGRSGSPPTPVGTGTARSARRSPKSGGSRRARRTSCRWRSFHVVFTLPHHLNSLAQGNPRVCYGLLFQAARETLATFGDDPRHLGGEVGGLAILHTWGQTLEQHLHLHGVVPGGALTRDHAQGLPAKPGFLFPVRALARVFRGKYLAGLQEAHARGTLRFAGGVAGLGDPAAFQAVVRTLRATEWVVYTKPPFADPTQVLEYLGRYTHRVAISNDRLVSVEDGQVRFRWKDYAHGDRVKTMTLPAAEFLRRFLLHVLPGGFVRIRHFGFLGLRRPARGAAEGCQTAAHAARDRPLRARTGKALPSTPGFRYNPHSL